MNITNISACGVNTPRVLAIGRQMEDNYRQFVFDCSDFGVEVTSITLVHQRSKDIAPYNVATSNTSTLTWTVSDTDTAYAGYGKAELRISFNNGLAKSIVFPTLVMASITADITIPQPLQSWYDAMIDYIDENSISQDELDQAIEDYIDQHPIQAPVTSVNGKIGAVVLTASDVSALPDSTVIPSKTSDLVNDSGFLSSAVTSFNGSTGAVTYTAPVSSVDGKTGAVTVIPTGGTTGQVLAKKTNADRDVEWQTVSGGGAVSSVNGRTGAVTVEEVYWCTYGTTTSAEIETAITAGYLPCVKYNDYVYVLGYRNSATNHRFICNYGGKEYTVVCQSGVWAPAGTLTFLTSAPVTSVNSKTGAVTLSASDVGALPDTYTAPVTSVNGQTGAVTVTDTDTTYTISISGNVITLTPSTGTAQSITLPADSVSSVDGKTGSVTVLPSGGSSGQVLSKASGTNYDVEWTTPQGGGGGSDWTLVNSVTLSEATSMITIDKDTNGNSFALKDVLVVYYKDRANDEGTNSAGKIKLVGQWGTFTYSFTKLNGGTFNDRNNEVTLKREYFSSKGNSIITCGAFNVGSGYDYSASFVGSEHGVYPAIRIELTNDNNSVTFPVNTLVEVYTK